MAQSTSETVAIVDDDPSVREGVHQWLQTIGLQVESFASAAEFLSGAPERFAKLILDQHMPQMTGLELVRKMRSNGIHMPIMLLTGNLTPGVATEAQDLGIERVSEKPPCPEDLSAFCLAIPCQ